MLELRTVRIAIAAATAGALVLAGCGSSGSSDNAATAPKPAATATQSTTATAASPPKHRSKPKSTAKPPPPPAPADTIHPGNFYAFKTPSGKIGCAYTHGPTTLRCDTRYPTRFSRSGHHCQEGDYGQSFEMSPAGRARAICAGDTVLSASGAKTIPYGHSWTIGPYNCASKTTGLTCTNGGGHGWRLSLQQQLLF